jgi:hypothetical protein
MKARIKKKSFPLKIKLPFYKHISLVNFLLSWIYQEVFELDPLLTARKSHRFFTLSKISPDLVYSNCS